MDIENQTDTSLIENLAAHLAVFPDWNLNDSEVRVRLAMDDRGQAMFELDVFVPGDWRRDELMSEVPKEYRVSIRFSGLRNLVLVDCDPPHIAGELILTQVAASRERAAHRRVGYEPIAGLGFTLECDTIAVVEVVPVDRSAAI